MAGLCDSQRFLLNVTASIMGLIVTICLVFIGNYLILLYLYKQNTKKHNRPKPLPWPFWVVFFIAFIVGAIAGAYAAIAPEKGCYDVVIVELVCDPVGGPLEEIVALQNIGNHTVDMDRWKLCDIGDKHCYTFERFKLAKQATVKLWTGMGVDTINELYWKQKNPIWDNNGDTARLLDSKGRIVDELSCTPPPPPTSTPTFTPSFTFIPSNTPTETITLPTPTGTPPTLTLTPTFTPTQTPKLVVHFIYVGQGDAILIVTPDGLTMLIDGGNPNTGVVDYLQGRGVKQIDVMIATHPNEDHIGGLIQVLQAMPVARVVTNGLLHTTKTYADFLDAITNSQAVYSEVKRDDTIALGDLKISVLNPGGNIVGNLNENSVVLRLEYGKTSFLFMGDAGDPAESSMMAAGMPLKSDILKVGHHGSCDSLSQPFLAAVQPKVGIYSAGKDNQYGYPCADMVQLLYQNGIWMLGTDVNGSIIVTVTMDDYQITNAEGTVLRR
jgi:beta-lactamase superfamily II metal-dependent hydrolase